MIEHWAEIKQLILGLALMFSSIMMFIMARHLKKQRLVTATLIWVILAQPLVKMTHLTHKTPKLTLKISKPSNFYLDLRSSNPKLWVGKRKLRIASPKSGIVIYCVKGKKPNTAIRGAVPLCPRARSSSRVPFLKNERIRQEYESNVSMPIRQFRLKFTYPM